MTLVGKIFTVLIFVLSLVFMTLSVMVYATQRNWKQLVMDTDPNVGYKARVERLRGTNETLATEIQNVENNIQFERAARQAVLQQLQTKLSRSETRRQDLEEEFSKKLADKQAINQELAAARDRLAVLTNEIATLRDGNRTLREDRDHQFEQVVALAGQVHQLEGVRRQLEERRDDLVNQYSEMKRVMDARGFSVNDPLDNTPPALDGVVTKVSKDNRMWIEISLGSDDGLRVGHELDVFRGKAYVGKVTIRYTSYNHAVAELDEDVMQRPAQEGDNVTTKLG